MANQSVETLSGGQQMVLAMLVVSNQRQRPFLLLDEPDNHLDIDAKTVLARAIKEYKGGILLISHDTVFIADCGITDTIHVKK
jgi:ATPase subunit of ABC transporter with duplicated ATPase domains